MAAYRVIVNCVSQYSDSDSQPYLSSWCSPTPSFLFCHTQRSSSFLQSFFPVVFAKLSSSRHIATVIIVTITLTLALRDLSFCCDDSRSSISTLAWRFLSIFLMPQNPLEDVFLNLVS